MKAAVFYEPSSKIPIEEVSLEKPKKGEVLVKLVAAGVCHSDYSFMIGHYSPTKAPFIMGHEGAGIISEIGEPSVFSCLTPEKISAKDSPIIALKPARFIA